MRPVNMLDPGAGKTKKAYVWAYARSGFDALVLGLPWQRLEQMRVITRM